VIDANEYPIVKRMVTTINKGLNIMNWDRIEGQWKQRRGKATHYWGKVMNDELAAIAGKFEELVGKLQEKYGIAKEESRTKVSEFKKNIERLKKANMKLIKAQNVLAKKKSTTKKLNKRKTAAHGVPFATKKF